MKPSKLCRCCPGAPKHLKLAMASRRAALSGYQYIVNYHLLYFCIYYFLWSTPPANATWYCVRSCLCVSVCPVCALFFESLDLDLETSFVVCRYIFGISRSGYGSKIRETSVAEYTHLRVVRLGSKHSCVHHANQVQTKHGFDYFFVFIAHLYSTDFDRRLSINHMQFIISRRTCWGRVADALTEAIYRELLWGG